MPVVRQGSRPLAHHSIGKTAVVVGTGVFGIEFDGTIVIGDSSVQIALAFFGKASVSVGFGVFRIEFDGTITVGDGTVVVTLVILARPRLLYAYTFFGSNSRVRL